MATRKHFRKPSKDRKVARERIDILFSQADKAFPERKDLADRYVSLARKIAMKLKVRIRPELKRRFCRHCYKYLRPGVNLRVRTTGGHVTYYCLECKKFMRFVYSKKK
ncbi:ribonuclease P [Candidatus Woesearchaeota archaeon]|nr:ribonuclease P [Candidatus Woesearchaeota archaeon]